MPHTILLADDSVTIRRVVELAFQDTDIRVDAVGSGSEAMDRLAVSPPDLVLADVVLPNASGYDLCRAVKGSDRPVPVLLLRGAFEPFDERRASICGADGSLVKPFEADRLVERVRTLLQRGSASAGPPGPRAPLDPVEQALDEIVEASADRSQETTEAAAEPDPVASEPAIDRGPAEVVSEPAPGHDPGIAPDPGLDGEPTVIRTEGPTDDRTAVPVQIVDPGRPERASRDDGPDPALVSAVADEVVRRLSDRVVREIAWEVVPDLAAAMIRQRLREIEREDPEDR